MSTGPQPSEELGSRRVPATNEAVSRLLFLEDGKESHVLPLVTRWVALQLVQGQSSNKRSQPRRGKYLLPTHSAKRIDMARNKTPQWQPLSMLPVVAQAIGGMLESAEEQQRNLRSVRDRPYVLDDAIVARLLRLYTEQRDDLSVYEEQLQRWQQVPRTAGQQRELERLRTQLVRLREAIREILLISNDVKSQTRERLLEKDDIEVGLDFLLGKRKL